ncbi:phospholipase C [Janthinobacterium sp. 1_2014MBL_MicDiv]|uniref:phospholipase C n=1 Tax=Janthinobacterium sp. 1_2014MBL_MicDiv TaxID=1644131 RepID=UPI0008F46C56|nr:alkaline phosphatase family protein [Janthinobacterium sp. 1_2014MBL_MicDiv]
MSAAAVDDGADDGGVHPLGNLTRIEHIVVLMMENRSFDHMLGYLSLEGGRDDIDGLRASHANVHAGVTYRVHRLRRTAFDASQDPSHTGMSVAQQLQNNNGGFVDDYVHTHPGDPDIDLVMGYYNGADLPMYDFLARQFCVCDRCYSSVPGATWPNRLYAVSGRAAGSKDSKRVPLYANKSFVRHLERALVSWKFYSAWKPWSLALTDDHYRSSEFYEPFGSSQRRYGFIGDALAGALPAVSWIDPHFFANDDHPPADIRAGQALVAQVYQALAHGPAWARTLLILSYDEHGGFFDHVPPPVAVDDDPAFRQYGVRVPMLLVSPLIAPGSVCHQVFDHTSIIKTILQRFCRSDAGGLPDMGARVAAASGLGEVLGLAQARPPPAVPATVLAQRAQWEDDVRRQDFAAPAPAGRPAANGAGGAASAGPAGPAAPLLSDTEAGAIAAHRQLARTARNALAAHGKPATQPAGRRRRQGTDGGTPQGASPGKQGGGRRG